MKRTIKIKLNKTTSLPVKYGNMYDLTSSAPYKLEDFTDFPVNNLLIDTGVAMTLPKWYGAKIYPRSSLFKNTGLIMANHVGIIEWNYSGQWYLNLIELSNKRQYSIIPVGFRLAQFEIYLLPEAPWYMKLMDLFISGFKFKKVDILSVYREGFGSTGNF